MLRTSRRIFLLTCKDVNRFLDEYIEGALDASLRSRFEKHIARCAPCKTYLDQYRTTIEAVQEMALTGEPSLPDELIEHTLVFLQSQIAERG